MSKVVDVVDKDEKLLERLSAAAWDGWVGRGPCLRCGHERVYCWLPGATVDPLDQRILARCLKCEFVYERSDEYDCHEVCSTVPWCKEEGENQCILLLLGRHASRKQQLLSWMKRRAEVLT